MAKIDSINVNQSKPITNFSNFGDTLPYRFANTYRFGEIGVHYAADVVPSENGKFTNSHVLRSYTMNNPLLQSFKMRKTYGLIPLSAILPLNYEKYIMIPNRGEDINAQLIGTSVKGFISRINNFFSKFQSFLIDTFNNSGPDDVLLTNFFRFILLYDMIYSNGGLLKSLGSTVADSDSTPDNDFDFVISSILTAYNLSVSTSSGPLFKLRIRDKVWYIGNNSLEVGIGHISLREALSRMRDDFSFQLFFVADISETFIDLLSYNFSAINVQSVDDSPFDLARCYAYQIFCAQFFSNDHVDSIYTAELYRQNLYSLVKRIIGSAADSLFEWNGVNYRYDVCSAFITNQVFDNSEDFGTLSSAQLADVCDYFRLIFGYNRSLRYGDYFTGSRTLPIAPGDVNVSVNGDSFSVVENIQKSWYARLYAQVQRVGRRLSAQTKALFKDSSVVQDWHEPIWLGETVSDVFAEEIDNTSSDMYNPDKPISTTSVLHSEQSALAFDLRVPDRYGVVLGFTWFDIARFYPYATDRSFFHVTRFDKFNPFLQFNGDQPIYRKELTSSSHSLNNDVFGYTGRYMEYKNNYNKCAGGFVDNTLPGLIFKADVGKDYVDIGNLSSDYIRSYPSEFDDFYLSLSGWSLGHYFHFMVINSNNYDGNKPMAYNPSLD